MESYEEWLEREREIFLAGFPELTDEQYAEIMATWEPSAKSRYESMLKQQERKAFLESASERVIEVETGVVESHEAIAELGVLVAELIDVIKAME